MTTQIAPAVAPPHAHHWVIEAPSGAESNGVCRICGEQRSFKNAAEQYWDRSNQDPDIARVAASAPREERRLSDDF